MSGDPAIAAAQRAWENGPASEIEFRPDGDGLLAAVAREMAAPLRKLHKPSHWTWCGDPMVSCYECGRSWPCDTARLLYSSSELEGDSDAQ